MVTKTSSINRHTLQSLGCWR